MVGDPPGARLCLLSDADVPPGDAWLSAAEREVAQSLRRDKRRADWRRGRWAAKRVLAHRFPNLTPDRIEIRGDALGAPRVHVDGVSSPAAISISHREDLAACALCDDDVPIGCDLEHIEPRSAAFVHDFFCASERGLWEAADATERPLLANLIWSAKESALKALGVGLRRDTRSVEVAQLNREAVLPWRALRITDHDTGRTLAGWWHHDGANVITLVMRNHCRCAITHRPSNSGAKHSATVGPDHGRAGEAVSENGR